MRRPRESDIYHGMVLGRAYVAMHRERIRAHEKYEDEPGGSIEEKSYDEPEWLPVLVEEVGEVARVLNDYRHGALDDDVMAEALHTELVQVGAMAAAWIDAIADR